MSSKQINFFLSPEDLQEVSDFITQKKCLIFKRKNEIPAIPGNYDIINNQESIFQVYLCEEKYQDKIHYEQTNPKEYFVDIVKSYCIEFSIGGFYPYSNKELHLSRFYYVFEYYEMGKLVKKEEEFINWADGILKSFKKQFLKKAPMYSNDFLSEKFIDWMISNNAKKTTDGARFIIQ
jgi:hypothetical protein